MRWKFHKLLQSAELQLTTDAIKNHCSLLNFLANNFISASHFLLQLTESVVDTVLLRVPAKYVCDS